RPLGVEARGADLEPAMVVDVLAARAPVMAARRLPERIEEDLLGQHPACVVAHPHPGVAVRLADDPPPAHVLVVLLRGPLGGVAVDRHPMPAVAVQRRLVLGIETGLLEARTAAGAAEPRHRAAVVVDGRRTKMVE